MTDENIKVVVQNGKHYIIDSEFDSITCIEDTLDLMDFSNKMARGELTGTWKVNRILRNRPN